MTEARKPSDPLIPHFYQSIPGYFSYPDFYRWLAGKYPDGHGVEVGSYMGRSAAFLAVEILNRGGLGRLDLVDTFTAGAPAAEVRRLLIPAQHVIGELHSCLSWDGAALYPDASLDYVYIDADHHYEAIARDIDAWLPKIKPGGIISGHDFSEYPGFGVIRAVLERFDRVDIWRGVRFDGDGVRVFESPEGLGLYYPSWCAVVPTSPSDPYDAAFFEQMLSCRDNYRKLGDVIHQVVGLQTSALDVGCGVGLQTKRLLELGWNITGAEYSPVAIELREPGVEIAPLDLSAPPPAMVAQVDCVICTETAEHIPEPYADRIVGNIASLATKTIIWSAAAPGQEWTGHINLQRPPYWLGRFRALGWEVDQKRSALLQELMLDRRAQHYLGRENFFVLVPVKPLHMTIVATVLNAEKWIGRHIESVQEQTFQNFTHVIIDAASEDGTYEAAWHAASLAGGGGPPPNVCLIRNDPRLASLENCWRIWKDLPDDEVIVWLDGDDWLAHDRALEVVARAYASEKEPWVTYGQFMYTDGEVGFAAPYLPGENPRTSPWRATHLKTFRAGLVKRLLQEEAASERLRLPDGILIRPHCLIRPDGSWATVTDKAVMYPLLEMAGEHQMCIEQVVSVYNYDASCAARVASSELDVELAEVERLRALPPFQPLTERPW